jgi:membrane protein YdbS with pleckstrin-like domain
MDAPESSVSAPVVVGPATPSLADGTRRSLDPRVVDLDRLLGAIVTACLSSGLLIAVGIFSAATDAPAVLVALLLVSWAAFAAALIWHTIRWPDIEYRHASYILNGQGIEIARGVIWRSIVSVPGSRVQHTDVSQGPLQRRYGLGTLTIYTAGTEYARVDLPGLAHATALAIRDHLLPKRSDDGV